MSSSTTEKLIVTGNDNYTFAVKNNSLTNIYSVDTINNLVNCSVPIIGYNNASPLSNELTTRAWVESVLPDTLQGNISSGYGIIIADGTISLEVTSNLKFTGNLLDTIQNIQTTSTPTFAGIYGAVLTATQNSITTLGNVTSLNSITVGSGTLSGLSSVSSTSFIGTITTATQNSITTLGGVTSLHGITVGSGTLSGLSSISSTSITGTLQTGNQPNITSLNGISIGAGTIGSFTLTGSLYVNIDSSYNLGTSFAKFANVYSYNLYGTLQTTSQPNIYKLDNVNTLNGINVSAYTLSGLNSVSATNLTGTLQTANQPNITTLSGVTSLNGITVGNGSLSGLGSISAANITGTISSSSNSQPNITTLGGVTSLNSITIGSGTIGSFISTGSIYASVDNIINIGAPSTKFANVYSTLFYGTIATAVQNSITTLGSVTSLNSISVSAYTLSGLTAVYTSTLNCTTIAQVTSLNSITMGSGTIGSFISTGTVYPSVNLTYSLGTNTNQYLNVYAGNIYGFIQTASQPNITTLGGVTSLNSITVGSGTLAGLSSISTTSVSATNLTGTLQTTSQPNVNTLSGVTSLNSITVGSGTLSGLSSINSITVGSGTIGAHTLTGSLTANVDGTLNIGTPSTKFANIYANNLYGTLQGAQSFSSAIITNLEVLNNFGIGINPSFPLHVAGSISTSTGSYFNQALATTGSGLIGMQVNNTFTTSGSTSSSIGFYNTPVFATSGSGAYTNIYGAQFTCSTAGTTTAYSIYASNPTGAVNNYAIYADTLKLGGQITSQTILPVTNNTYDLGSNSSKFGNVYATNFYGTFNGTFTGTISPTSITLSGYECIGTSTQVNSSLLTLGTTSTTAGITFNNNTSGYSPTDLHYYEELSISPTWQSTSGASSNFAGGSMKLVRCGALVVMQMTGPLTWTAGGSDFSVYTTSIPSRFQPNNYLAWSNLNGYNSNNHTYFNPVLVFNSGQFQFQFTYQGTQSFYTPGTNYAYAFTISYTVL
jgi:hypothetical protein